MSLHQHFSKLQKIASDNSPAILTGIAVAGTITTAYLASKASFRASKILEDETMAREITHQSPHRKSAPPMTTREKGELIWKLYIPAISSGIFTCAAVVYANRIGTKRTAAMAAAFSLADLRFDEYRAKVVETIGEKKETALRDELQQERFTLAQAQRDPKAILPGKGHTLCFDQFSNTAFMCDMETLRKAENDINFRILNQEYATVSDFYDIVGLPETSISSEVGWNHYKKMELAFSAVLDEYDNPCLAFGFAVVPIRDPWNYDSIENFRH